MIISLIEKTQTHKRLPLHWPIKRKRHSPEGRFCCAEISMVGATQGLKVLDSRSRGIKAVAKLGIGVASWSRGSDDGP
ncbi:MAG: hypothetical protein ACI97A_001854 [Planctomycetota bacterium]|jgi:hypothetical protein